MGNIQRKPEWLKSMFIQQSTKDSRKNIADVRRLMDDLKLNTVCKEANCPNLGECYSRRTATFMIMGSRCTRNCRFCDVAHGQPSPIDAQEPEHIAEAVVTLGLKHIVITSVTRDDLPHGGAEYFATTTRTIRKTSPDVTIELLIPDLLGNEESLDIVMDANPDILNHNMETVRPLYAEVRPQADYDRSLHVLAYCKQRNKNVLTKTGIMVGLGETEVQVHQIMEDILDTGCDILTIGQYLRPSKEHLPVHEFIEPLQFDKYREVALAKGFAYVASGPLVRSSYHANVAFHESRRRIKV